MRDYFTRIEHIIWIPGLFYFSHRIQRGNLDHFFKKTFFGQPHTMFSCNRSSKFDRLIVNFIKRFFNSFSTSSLSRSSVSRLDANYRHRHDQNFQFADYIFSRYDQSFPQDWPGLSVGQWRPLILWSV